MQFGLCGFGCSTKLGKVREQLLAGFGCLPPVWLQTVTLGEEVNVYDEVEILLEIIRSAIVKN
jgi:hypothetical protein